MGGHDCPATRYNIMSDYAALVITILIFSLATAAYWLQRFKRRVPWLEQILGSGSSIVAPINSKQNGKVEYGAVSPNYDRAKTLQLDRYGVTDEEKRRQKIRGMDDEKEQGVLAKYLAAQQHGSVSVPSKQIPSVAGTKKKARKPRIHYFDNCRWWLETAVILKHTLEFFPPGGFTRNTSWWMEGISNYFETFFMAMFVFCSGFLSKGEMNERRAKRYLFRVWIPFVLINFINRGVDKGWEHWLDNFPSFTNAYDTSWFLACVIQWRMVVTFFATMTPSGRMGVALILSWFSGYFFTATPTFHLAETLSFLPFYLAGHMVTREHVEMIKKDWIQKAAMAASLFFFLFIMLFSFVTFSPEETEEYSIRTFEGQREAMTIFTYSGYIKGWQRCHYFTTSNPSEVDNYWIVWCHRVVYQAIVWVMGLAFILMVPHDRRFYTESGGYTIYPYLLQIFFFALERNAIRYFTGRGVVPTSNVLGWFLIILSIPAVNLLLSSFWSRKIWWIVFEPSWLDWALFDSPNKTISPFVGKELIADESNRVEVSNLNTVRGTIREIADKENLDSNGLEVVYKGKVLGDFFTVETLEEVSGYEITEVKTVHLEPRYLALFSKKRKVHINKDVGYGWTDFVFSVIGVTLILTLIALTKGSPTTPPATTMPSHAPSHVPSAAATSANHTAAHQAPASAHKHYF
eukprot:CAMPEP_0184490116 /NCGR_PEP_ID=MMETSP0113_2-20130426/17188_1 /TAXON_ID=91329 /ORGANISM="Norrisiella sphaerica, Strain BC52" /LENGTH=687 /DNA_ID=CAMNT_0026873875 /DNA_START=47 /DNA_END=2110 /DNA_ORIENTATION=+